MKIKFSRWASRRDAPGHVPSGSPRPRVSDMGDITEKYGETMGKISLINGRNKEL